MAGTRRMRFREEGRRIRTLLADAERATPLEAWESVKEIRDCLSDMERALVEEALASGVKIADFARQAKISRQAFSRRVNAWRKTQPTSELSPRGPDRSLA